MDERGNFVSVFLFYSGGIEMKNEGEKTLTGDYIQCIHHWLIDERNLGVCKKCGESRQFSCSWSAVSIQKAWCKKSEKLQQNAPGIKG